MSAGPSLGTKFNQTQNTYIEYIGVRLRLIRAGVKRERAQTNS